MELYIRGLKEPNWYAYIDSFLWIRNDPLNTREKNKKKSIKSGKKLTIQKSKDNKKKTWIKVLAMLLN
jgi:hypothetical protein